MTEPVPPRRRRLQRMYPSDDEEQPMACVVCTHTFSYLFMYVSVWSCARVSFSIFSQQDPSSMMAASIRQEPEIVIPALEKKDSKKRKRRIISEEEEKDQDEEEDDDFVVWLLLSVCHCEFDVV